MTHTATVLLTTVQARRVSASLSERELAARYEAGVRRLIEEIEGEGRAMDDGRRTMDERGARGAKGAARISN